jgi:hypothetical protein
VKWRLALARPLCRRRYSLLVLIALDAVVANPRFKRFQVLSTRTQNFGLILLLSGAALQLVVAVQDFLS